MTVDRRTLLSSFAGAALVPLLGLHGTASAAGAGAYDWQKEFSALPGVKMTGTEQVAMLLYPGFTALDLVGPYHFLAGMMGAGVHLVTNQTDLRPVPSDLGLAVQPTMKIEDCPRDLTIIFLPGGTDGTIAAARDARTLAFVRDRAARAQYITSVCTGSLILGVAGLLKGRKATSHWSVRDLLGQFGATPVNQRVVQDGNVITGAGVSSGLDFGLSLVQTLRGHAYASGSMLTAEYDPQPPFPGGTVEKTPPEVARPMQGLFEGFVAEAKTLRPLR